MTPNFTRALAGRVHLLRRPVSNARFLSFAPSPTMSVTTWNRLLLVLSIFLLGMSSSFSQTTYNFNTNATLSFGEGGFGFWYTQADITVDGVAYKLTCGGNGSFTNAANGGNGNSKCLSKDGSGGDFFSIKRADGQPFQFYGLWIKHFSMRSYLNASYFVQVQYTKTVGGTETWTDPTSVSGSGTTTQQITLTKDVAVTEVKVNFTSIMNFWIDDLIVGPAAAATPPSITSNPPNRTICAGNNTSFSISASNATSYRWQVNTGSGFTNISNGGVYSNATTTTLNITGATAAMNGYTYRCVATGSASPAATSNAGTLTVNSLSATQSTTSVSCFGGSNGVASVSVSGGTAPYSYSWAPSGGTASTATGLGAGTYTCTITDNLGCQTTQTATVTQPAAALSASIYKTDVSCNGGSNGTATVVASGGTAPYTYSWSPSGGTNATATGLSVGTYTCTITDGNGCQATKSITILQPSSFSVATAKTDVSCNGGSNGSASVTVSGATAPYYYSWAPFGGTAATATGLSAGSYTVTITDNNNCQTTRSFTILQPSAIAASISKTDVSCNGGSNGTATVTVSGGAAPYTYSWSPSGGTAATAAGLAAGTYTCTITDNNGCTSTKSITITQPTGMSTTTSQINVSCNGGSNGSAGVTVSGGSGNYSYSWSPSGGTVATATGLAAGNYSVTITDNSSGCQITRNFTITQPPAFSVTTSRTDVSCFGGSNGSATVTVSGASGPYFYSWSPSGGTAATATGLTAGTYTVTITDANTCQTTRSFTILQPAALAASTSVTNVSCNGGANGTATVVASGGTAPYSYAWSPSGGTNATATGLVAGTYTVTITDANGCQTTKTATVTQPPAMNASTSKTDVSCNGGANGTASIVVSGGAAPYSYSWAPMGGTAATATGLPAGTYTVTVTDNNSCQTTRTVTIVQPSALAVGTSQTNVACNGGASGALSVSVSGGTAPYTYSWSPGGSNSNSITGLVAGNYSCLITDANGCTSTRNFTITQPSALVANISKTDVSCNGGSNGTATVSGVSGGTAPYTYSWSPAGGSTATATGLAAGTYTCTITDANNCQLVKTITIGQPTAFSVTTSSSNVSCFNGSNGTASVTVSGATAPYSYSWAPMGGTAATATGLPAGTYTVTITDNNTCQTTRSITITQPAALSASTSFVDESCAGALNGSASISVTGGTAPYTYQWSGGAGSTATVNGLAAGTYTCVVTDANGCSISKSVTLSTKPLPTVQPVMSQTICNQAGTGAVSFSGTVNGTTYHWTNTAPEIGLAASGSGNIASFQGINNGNTAVTAQIEVTPIADGCTGSSTSFQIIVNPTPVVNVIDDQTVCNNVEQPAVVFNSNVSGVQYAWTNDQPGIGLAANGLGNLPSFAAVNPTHEPIVATISVFATANGCSGPVRQFTITINPTPSVNTIDNQVVCNNNEVAAIAPSGSSVTGTSYEWSNSLTSIGLAASGTGTLPAFTAINNGTTVQTATIEVTPMANGCAGPAVQYTITVNPTPVVVAPVNQVLCADANTQSVVFSGAVEGTTYTWTNDNTSIGLAASGAGNIPAFTATNSGSNAAIANITVTPHANGCAGPVQSFSITVKAKSQAPTAVIASNTALCGPGNVDLQVEGGALGTGAAWKWYKDACGQELIGEGASLTQVQVDQTSTFYVRAEGDCNTTSCASITVVVNPQPVISIAAAPHTSLLPGMTTTLTASISPSVDGQITWYRNNTWVPASNSGSLQVNVDGLGTYRAEYTTVNNCVAVSNEVIIRDSASGRIFIAPNPSNGQFTVRYYHQGTSNQPRQLMVFDSKGALVFSKAFTASAPYSAMQVNLTGHAHGIYFVRLIGEDGKVIGKDQVRIF